jgi:hypothetical protein
VAEPSWWRRSRSHRRRCRGATIAVYGGWGARLSDAGGRGFHGVGALRARSRHGCRGGFAEEGASAERGGGRAGIAAGRSRGAGGDCGEQIATGGLWEAGAVYIRVLIVSRDYVSIPHVL